MDRNNISQTAVSNSTLTEKNSLEVEGAEQDLDIVPQLLPENFGKSNTAQEKKSELEKVLRSQAEAIGIGTVDVDDASAQFECSVAKQNTNSRKRPSVDESIKDMNKDVVGDKGTIATTTDTVDLPKPPKISRLADEAEENEANFPKP